jgi:hypothetical protein
MKLSNDQVCSIAFRIALPGALQVVLIDVGGRKDIPPQEHNSNIYCVDSNGLVVWQVSAPKPLGERDSFVDMELDGDILRANRFFGTEYVIDPLTGSAQETGWHK